MRPIAYSVFVMFLLVTPAVAADKVKLLVQSDPMGAMVYYNAAQQMGAYAPYWLQYNVGKGFFKNRRCQTMQPITVRWASGVYATLAPTLCGQSGKTQQLVFRRPDGVEGAAIDAQFAIQVQQLAIMRQQADAADYANYLAQFKPLAPIPMPRTCTSTVILNQVITRCN